MTPYTPTPPTEPGLYYAKDRHGVGVFAWVLEATNGGLLWSDGHNTYAMSQASEWGPRIPTPEELVIYWGASRVNLDSK